jgi:hypothetical protein
MVCFESRDVGLVVRVRGEAVDPLGQIEAGLEMAGGMAVSLGFAAIEGEIDHGAQEKRGGEGIDLFQRFGSRRQQPVLVAVAFAMALQDQICGQVRAGQFIRKSSA